MSIDEVWEEVSPTVFQTVRIGSRVRLQDESGAEALYTIAPCEQDGHLSGGLRLAPALIRALLGRRVGEEVHVWTSSRGWRVKILEVD
jgi:transcription elongation GreA/GreB family factor